MAWEGSWTLAGTPGAYQAEMWGLVGKDSRPRGGGRAWECALAAAPSQPGHGHRGPIEPCSQGPRPALKAPSLICMRKQPNSTPPPPSPSLGLAAAG